MFTKVANVQHSRKNNMRTSCRNTKQWRYLVQFPSVTSYNSSHTFNMFHLLALRASTTRTTVNTLASNMRAFMAFIHLKFCIVLSLQPCCNMLNVYGGDFCSKTHNLILLRSLTRHFLHQRNHTHTHTHTKPQSTNKCCYAIRSY